MSLTHMWSCRDTVSRRRTGALMATSCLRPKFLSSRCGLWIRQCSRMVLATRSAAWGERHPLSELRSCPPLPKFGLVHAVTIYATSRRSAESNTHRAASPQMYPHPWRSRRSGTWSVHVAGRCRLRTSTRKWQLRWVPAWSERLVQKSDGVSDTSLLLASAGGCRTERGAASPGPANSFPAEAVAVGLPAEDGNDFHASHTGPL